MIALQGDFDGSDACLLGSFKKVYIPDVNTSYFVLVKCSLRWQ